jgi:hypothetical protein
MKKLMLIAIVLVSFAATSCDKSNDIFPKKGKGHCVRDTVAVDTTSVI